MTSSDPRDARPDRPDERYATLRARHGLAVGRACFALLGSQGEAEQALKETLESALEDEDVAPADLERAGLLGLARRYCARRLETRGRPDAKTAPSRAERLLGELRPTEREALVLRYVATLPAPELAEACEADEATVLARVARGLARLRDEEVEPPREKCERVAEAMPALLESKAASELAAHARDCDYCRDARHDAEQAIRQLQALADDFVLPAEVAPAPAAAEPKPASSERAPSRAAALAKRWAAPLLALAAAAAVVAGRGHSTGTSADDPELVGPPWRGKVKKLLTHDGKLELCAPSGGACHALRQGDDVPAGSVLKTDRATLAELAFTDESVVSLDRGTTLRLSTRGRGGELLQGGLVADIAHHENWSARFEFKSGHLDVLGTKFSLRSDSESASVHVARGSVQLSDGSGHNAIVLAGEEGRVDVGAAPITSPATSLGEALGWSEAVQAENEGENEPEARPRALGELKAQKPGERTERAGAVRLDSHQVRVKIAGSIARTEVEEVFTNQTDDVLEGIFRFPLPPDAKIERLALEVDGKLEEGAFVDRDRASAIWRGAIVNAAPQLRQEIKDEIVWVPGPWRDPALLEWQRGGRFELRIFPIPKRGSRRVVLAYSQLVKQSAGLRHYSYPLGFDPSGNATPLDFSVDVQLRGIDSQTRVRTPGWEVSREREDGAQRLRFDARSFVPNGDFSVDYALAERDAELSAWAYRDPSPATPAASADAGQAYVALSLRPRLPKRISGGPLQAVALVVDASRSVYGENYHRATALAARLARDLDTSSRVTVLACDTTCREMPGELRVPGVQAAREVRRFLEHEVPEGASDVTLAVAQGFQAIADTGREPRVIYIGDGVATAGPTRSSTIERAVRATLPANGRVTSLGIGPESDAESLLALARGGAGTALPYVPGQPLVDASFAAISAVYGAALSNVRLELPEGITQVSPARLDPISAGSELIVTGRTSLSTVKGDVVLRGTVDGRPFEQRYRLDLAASDSSGNAFVPRLFAAGRIADLERDGSDSAKREAVALSTQHGVASRFTSLLVLESEAMYKAFGLDTAHKTPDYTADLEADGTSASGELALNEQDDAAPGKDEAKGLSGLGTSAGASAPEEKRADKAAGRGALSLNPYDFDLRSGGGAGAPAPQGPSPARKPASVSAPKPAFAPAPAASATPEPEAMPERAREPIASKKRVLVEGGDVLEQLEDRPRPLPRPRQWIPMRRVWERKGDIFTDRFVPQAASGSALSDAERALLRDDSRRQNLKRAFALSSAAGDLGEAARLAERWLEKEPLDPEAITALADVEARRGHRELSIRMLGSVLDVRPGDTASHKRLARLERWAGHADLACRHSIAIAENKGRDLDLVADAIRCARETGMTEIADALLSAAADADRRALEQRLTTRTPDAGLNGDVRLEASWSGDLDLDLSLLDTDGHRVSWLGAATRSVITASDATSTAREGLALRGAAPGEYVVELVRGSGPGDAQGELVITVAGNVRRVPFRFDGDRKTVALVRVSMQPRLVPL